MSTTQNRITNYITDDYKIACEKMKDAERKTLKLLYNQLIDFTKL